MNRHGARTPYDQYGNRIETTGSDPYGARNDMRTPNDPHRTRSGSRPPTNPFGNDAADSSDLRSNHRYGGNWTPDGVPRAVPLAYEAEETELHNVIRRPTAYHAPDEKSETVSRDEFISAASSPGIGGGGGGGGGGSGGGGGGHDSADSGGYPGDDKAPLTSEYVLDSFAEDPFRPLRDLPDENQWVLTGRALTVGLLAGAFVNASNLYLGLKSGWTFSANLFGVSNLLPL
jgi:hypothetical protein